MDDTQTLELPAPVQFELDGRAVTIRYEHDYYLTARVCFPPSLLRLQDEILTESSVIIGPSLPYWRYTFVVVDETGSELVSSPVISSLQMLYDDHVRRERRDQNYDTLSADLGQLTEEVRDLRGRNLPVAEIETALRAAREAVDNLYGYWKATTFNEAHGRLARVRRLIAELDGSAVTVMVRGLMSGTIYHRDVYWNRQVRERQLVLWIRLGGDTPLQEHVGGDAIDLLTDDRLAAIYTEMLLDAGVKNLTDVDNTNLTLDLDTYAPEWLLEVPELDAAPSTITIPTSRKTVTTHVTYSLREDGGVLVPTGTAQMALNEYRTARSLPALPHGIELVLELTLSGEVVVRGPVGEVLTRRVKSYKGGQNRARNAPPSDLIRTKPVGAGETPPWLVTRRPVRWR